MIQEEISYNQALKELQEILEDIKEQNIDVDKLSAKVKRAKELINICEERIKQAEIEVKDVTKTLPSKREKQ